MANGWGGKRRNQGRPYGSINKVPRASKDDDRIRTLVSEVENAEFFITNAEKVFAGNSRDFLVAVYKAEQLPVRIRLYAASKAIEYEAVRDEIAGVPRPTVDTGEALIAAINKLRFTEDEPKGPAEIIPPALPRPSGRPKPGPVTDVAEDASAASGPKSADGGANSPHGVASEPSKSDPEPVHEITPEETAIVSALPPHLRSGRWASK